MRRRLVGHPQKTEMAILQCEADGRTLERVTYSGQSKTRKNREAGQRGVRDEHQTSTTLVLDRDRQDGVSGDHAKVHEDVCQTLQKDESEFPVGCTQGQTPKLDMKRRIGVVPAAVCSSGSGLMRKCSMKTTHLTLDNFVCSDEYLVRLDGFGDGLGAMHEAHRAD